MQDHRELGPMLGVDQSKVRKPPDFFIVGQPKTGTTALYAMLRRHPQIYMPALKEPDYFATDLRRRFDPPGWAAVPQTLDDYLALFAAAKPQQRVGEASVTTYLLSKVAADNIRTVQPHARIIAILREPTSLLRSLHLQLLQTHDETEKSLQRALRMEPDRRAGRRIPRSSWRPQLLLYSDYVRYTEQLRRYQTAFGEKQMLVLIYDDYRHSNEAVVRDVLRFLDVDDSVPVAEVEANETVRLRSRRVDDVVLALSVGHGPVSRYAKAAVKSLTPQRLRRRALELTWRRVVYGTPRPPDERFLVELRQRFKPEVVALSEHLGRDLVTLWGYDKVR